MTPAERIARAVLESHASAYHVTEPTQFAARARVILSAAAVVEPILQEILTAHAEAICTENPS